MSMILERRTALMNSNMLALTDADLKKHCPSVFAAAPRNDVSSRYGFVSSEEVLKALRENGFVPTHARNYMRRDPSNIGFTKHMVRFRKAGENIKKMTVGDVVPQIIMVNSHDRSSLFQFFGGLFRLVCSNGLMVSESSHIQPIVIRHTVSSVDGVIQACETLIKQQKGVFEHVEEMKGTMLNEKQALQFAHQAMELRPQRAGAIDPALMLTPRRTEDAPMDVWHVFNRVQENMMRGGQTGITANNRAIVTRGVDSVNADLHINVGLWRIAMETIANARTSSAAAVRQQAPAKPRKAPAKPANAAA